MTILVLLPDDPALAAVARARCHRVVQEASARLLVCDAAPAEMAGSSAAVLCSRAEVDSANLDASERLFAEAWLAGSADKDRSGDGLRWDAPSFEPP